MRDEIFFQFPSNQNFQINNIQLLKIYAISVGAILFHYIQNNIYSPFVKQWTLNRIESTKIREKMLFFTNFFWTIFSRHFGGSVDARYTRNSSKSLQAFRTSLGEFRTLNLVVWWVYYPTVFHPWLYWFKIMC